MENLSAATAITFNSGSNASDVANSKTIQMTQPPPGSRGLPPCSAKAICQAAASSDVEPAQPGFQHTASDFSTKDRVGPLPVKLPPNWHTHYGGGYMKNCNDVGLVENSLVIMPGVLCCFQPWVLSRRIAEWGLERRRLAEWWQGQWKCGRPRFAAGRRGTAGPSS